MATNRLILAPAMLFGFAAPATPSVRSRYGHFVIKGIFRKVMVNSSHTLGMNPATTFIECMPSKTRFAFRDELPTPRTP